MFPFSIIWVAGVYEYKRAEMPIRILVSILFLLFFYPGCSATNALQLISRSNAITTTANAASGGDPWQHETSSSARYTVFGSPATNLNVASGYLPYNTLNVSQIFIYDRYLDVIRPVTYSAGSTTTAGNANSRKPSVSDDGCYVTYESQATNLLSVFVSSGVWRIYLTNICVSPITTVLVSVGATGDSFRPRVSDNGNVVVFDSASAGIVSGDTNAASDVFSYNISSTVITRVSFKSSVPTRELQGSSTTATVSADGTKIAFLTTARNSFDSVNGTVANQVIYTQVGTTNWTCMSCGTAGTFPSSGASADPHISSTGAYLVWSTAAMIANYTGVEFINNAVSNIFWVNITAGFTGGADNARSYSVKVCDNNATDTLNGNSFWPQVSDDGNLVFFATDATNVLTDTTAPIPPTVQTDSNGATDVYVHSISAGTTSLVSQRNAAPTSGNAQSSYPSISRDGAFIVFATNGSNMVANDTNAASDVVMTPLVQVQLPACYCSLNSTAVNCTFNCTSDGICGPNENSGICINATMGDCFNCTINGKCDCVESENCTDCSSTPCTPNGICALNENYHNCPADCHLCSVDANCTGYNHTAVCTVLFCDSCVCRESTPNTTCLSLYTGQLQCLNYTICDPTNTTGLADANGCVYVLNNNGTSCNDGYNCTFNDVCTSGVCQGTSNNTVCSSLFPKTCLATSCSPFSNATYDVFDVGSGCKYNRTNATCNDAHTCTTEYCDERVIGNNATTGCNFSFNDTVCTSTFTQTCLTTSCSPNNGSADRIDSTTGCAIFRHNATCTTGLTCLQRFCNEQNANASVTTGCYTVLAPGGTACEPDLFTCTDALCDGLGNCQQVNNDTNCPMDGTICSIETCNPSQTSGDDYNSTTGCFNQVQTPGTPCESDGYICTMDVCQGASCVHNANNSLCQPFPGTAPFEYAACAQAVCEPGVNGTYVNNTYGCYFHNQPANTTCDDGFTCTYSDVCAGVGFSCNGTTNNTVCDPTNQNSASCQDNNCVPRSPGSNSTTGCLATNSTSGPCDDGVACTVDTCNATGICVGAPNNTYCANQPPALGNPCITGTCNALTGCVFTNVTNGTDCTNDVFTCTIQYCDGSGSCLTAYDNNTCATGNPCVQGICDPTNGGHDPTTGCYYVNLTIACDDSKICTYNDTCFGGTCSGLPNNTYCDSLPPGADNPCIDGTCAPSVLGANATTGCVFTNNTSPCDDGFSCTSPDVCSGGVCTTTPNDGFCISEAISLGQCLNATCSPASMGANVTTGCLFANLTAGQSCTDGQPCTFNDTCGVSGCQGTNNDTYCESIPPAFNNTCVVGTCNGSNGCVNTNQSVNFPCDDDVYTCTYQLCDGGTTCVTFFNDSVCASGDQCVTGTCSPSTPGSNATTGCVFTNNTNACTDGFTCTFNDTCNGAGVCVGTPNNTFCASGDTCITGTCNITAPGHDVVTGCVNSTNTNNCTDGFTCTFPDVCSGGMCTTTPNNSTCFAEAQSYNQCLSAACLPASIGHNVTTGCLFFNLTSNESCNDTIFCTLSDGCVNGTCVGTPSNATCETIPPGLNNACITGYCDPLTDCFFVNETVGTDCTNDTFTCTTQACDGNGNCVETRDNATCATGDTCVLGICDPTNPGRNATTGCYYVNTTNSCNDNRTCTYNDTCTGGICTGTHNDTFCDSLSPGAGNPCIDGTCSPFAGGSDNVTGCIFVNNTSPCDDGFNCTFPDVCSGGVCTTTDNNAFCGNEALSLGGCFNATCDPNDPSHNATTGCVFIPSASACTDQYTCTINDICVNVTTCQGTPTDSVCNGMPPALGNACIHGTCTPGSGDPTSGCSYANRTNGFNCTNDVFTCTTQSCDGNGNCITSFNNTVCATGDVCVQGICDPSNPGHNATTGCYYVNTTSPCTDGVSCTVDTCSGGVCVSVPNNTFCSLGNPCVTYVCNVSFPGANLTTGCYSFNNTDACDDGVACTINDVCSLGVCAGTPNNASCPSTTCRPNYCNATSGCMPSNATIGTNCTTDSYTCTTEACDGAGTCATVFNNTLCPASGNQCIAAVCSPAVMGANATTGCVYPFYPNGTGCSDNFTCTNNDICDGSGNCVGIPEDGFCAALPPALGNLCVSTVCNITSPSANTTTGCVYTNNTVPCDDGFTCTEPDTCTGGVCVGTPNNATCIADANASGQCKLGLCNVTAPGHNATTGCVFSNLTNGESCDDGVACTFPDICLNNTCTSTPNNSSCNSNNPCVDYRCDPLLGCVLTNKTAGTACNNDTFTCTSQACDGAGVCVTTYNNATCATGNVCIDGFCDPASIFANATTGCVTQFNIVPCNDGFNCTVIDLCNGAGVCVGIPNNTICENTAPALNDPCIGGMCMVSSPSHDAAGCTYFNTTLPCDDSYVCTTNDTCANGECLGVSDGVTCINLANMMGTCVNATCDPFNLIHEDPSGCTFTNLTLGEACDDGNACTVNDTCSVGICNGTLTNSTCSYLDTPCTMGICNTMLGCLALNITNGTGCDTDNFTCTYQLCAGNGTCVTYLNDTVCPSTGNPCIDNICDPGSLFADPTTGCRLMENHIPCDDGFSCTFNDTCSGGVCAGTPVHAFCDALTPSVGNPCIDGFCNVTEVGHNATTGCIYLNNTNPCSDGYSCTDDVCSGGTCVATPDNTTCIVEAMLNGTCAMGYCDPASATNVTSGCVIAPLSVSNACDDGVACTSNDTCVNTTTCAGTANDTLCSGFTSSCSNSFCNATTGCFNIPVANGTDCTNDTFTCTTQLCDGNGACLIYFNDSACPSSGNPCIDNVCDPYSFFADPVTGCRLMDNHVPCDDGFSCTFNDTCSGGNCTGTPTNAFCDALAPSLGNPCIDGFCNITDPAHNATTGCIYLNASNPCSDGFSCTTDVCTNGTCVSTPDDTPCILQALLQGGCGNGVCNVSDPTANVTSGCVITTSVVGASCNDNVACTFNDTCGLNGTCQGMANNTVCGAFNGTCSVGTCDLINGCFAAPVANNTPCDIDTYTCTYQLCNATGGCVTYYNDSVCTSANSCLVGFCDPTVSNASATTGCWFMGTTGNACDDGLSCTSNDTCSAGVCTGTLNDTVCANIAPALGNVCFSGTCDPQSIFASNTTGCIFSFNNSNPCDDGIPCTNNDTCLFGTCFGTPQDSFCEALSPGLNNPCIDGTCTPGSGDLNGCTYTNNTLPCNDTLACTTNDTCSNGACHGVDDGVYCPAQALLVGPCATGACDALNATNMADSHGCVITMLTGGQPCNDSISCTMNDICLANATCHGTPNDTICANLTLPAGLSADCTQYVCNGINGCILSNVTNGTSCNTGFVCMQDGLCDGLGHCVGTPNNTYCDGLPQSALDDCVNGTCDINDPGHDNVTGCVFFNNTSPCDDGLDCTINDVCASGTCRGVSDNTTCVTIANSIGMCVVGICAPEAPFLAIPSGCIFNFAQAGQSCDDGLNCTYNDICTAGQCVGTPNNTQCLDTLPMGMEEVCVTPLCLPYGIGCLYIGKPSGTPCNDSSPDDGATCTDKRCHSATNTCEETPIPGFCDVVGQCVLGQCSPGSAFANNITGCVTYLVDVCNDGIPCTTDACSGGNCTSTPDNSFCVNALPDPTDTCIVSVCNATAPGADVNGCVYANVTDGTPCDDGFLCTDDACLNGLCVGTADNITCQALALIIGGCNQGICDPLAPNATNTGCYFIPINANNTCDDLVQCTYNDTCMGNQCEGTPNNTYCVENQPPQYDPACVIVSCDPIADCLYIPQPNTTNCTSDGYSCTDDLCSGTGSCNHIENDTNCPVATTCATFQCHPLGLGADPITGCQSITTAQGVNCTEIPEDGFLCTTRQCNGLGLCVETPDDSLCPSISCLNYICNITSPDADPITGCVVSNTTSNSTLLLDVINDLALSQATLQTCAAAAPVCMTGPANPGPFWNGQIPASSVPPPPPTVPPINCTLIGGVNYTVSCVNEYQLEILQRVTRAVDCELALVHAEQTGTQGLFGRMCECEALCNLGLPQPPQCPAAVPWARTECSLGPSSLTGTGPQIAAVKHISCATLALVLDEMNYALSIVDLLIGNCTAGDNISMVRRFPNNTYWATMQYEDTLDSAFDFDYNDFVGLMFILESFDNSSQLASIYIMILPLARGSTYEHKLIFAHDGKVDVGTPNLMYQMPKAVVYGNYTMVVQRFKTDGTYSGIESMESVSNGGTDLTVISSTMMALMNPVINSLDDYFVNTLSTVPLKKAEHSYHLFLQVCNGTLNPANTRPLPRILYYYFYLRSVGHFDQTPILYDVGNKTVLNGMDILDADGHSFGFVNEGMVDWPVELYKIDPRFPGFMEIREWFLDPVANSPLSPGGEFWYRYPNPSQANLIIDAGAVPEF